MGHSEGERPSPHPYVLLAKRAVCLTASRLDPFLYIDRGQYCAMPEMTVRRGCFVSIKKGPHGELRGCIGTIRPVRENLWEEIVANARAAASEDPRFPPLEPGETAECLVSVDILDEPAPIEDLSELDPFLYGVIVERGGRKGVLLPDLEGVDTVEQQISIAMRKAGIGPEGEVVIYRFKVSRFSEVDLERVD
ncbi:MAG TPA: AmmeMemoRadiSam system protein A [Synergistales bacterium]|nr:AmmeMemoRadiSam system protein A [Synergistales bacterium]